jgi:cytochrome c-type biogenesis protein CcmH/NrfG
MPGTDKEDQETVQWIATGTFLDSLNDSITKLSEAVDRNTAVASSLDKRLVALETKDVQRDLAAALLAAEEAKKRSISATFKDLSNHAGDWLWKQRTNPLVVVPATAVLLKYFPAMSAMLLEALKLLAGG